MINTKSYIPTVVDRARRKPWAAPPGREPPDDSAGEPQRSAATDQHIETFLDALQNGVHAEQGYIFDKIVNAWRADNAAGGLPVYAHPPLPDVFADHLAATIKQLPEDDRKVHLEGITAKLEPGTRLAVLKQLGHAMATLDIMDLPQDHAVQHAEAPDTTPPEPGIGLVEGLHMIHARMEDPRLNSLVASLLQNVAAQDHEDPQAQSPSTRIRPITGRTSIDRAVAQSLAHTEDAATDGLQSLELGPGEGLGQFHRARYVDENGKLVIQTEVLADGTTPPPHPAYNKVLPIQSTVNTREHPPHYSSGAYDPTALGLRRRKSDGKPQRHDGIDFHAQAGEPVRVAADGVVVAVETNVRGYGTLVAVRHPDGTMTMYAHLDSRSIRVRPGQIIGVGTIVGGAGTTGNAMRPQVHFEVWRQAYFLPGGRLDYDRGHRDLIDPYDWFDQPMQRLPLRPSLP